MTKRQPLFNGCRKKRPLPTAAVFSRFISERAAAGAPFTLSAPAAVPLGPQLLPPGQGVHRLLNQAAQGVLGHVPQADAAAAAQVPQEGLDLGVVAHPHQGRPAERGENQPVQPHGDHHVHLPQQAHQQLGLGPVV